MGSEWRKTIYGGFAADFVEERLARLCDPNGGIQTGPFGSQLHQGDYIPVGTPIITVEHLGENRITHEGVPCVSDADKNRLSRYLLRAGDIVFSRVGSVDRRALVGRAEAGWMFSGRCLRVRPNTEKIDASYLSYFFGLPAFKEHIRAVAVGATMPSLNTAILSDVIIPHPPSIHEQRAIAHILGTLDDKIEINRKQNETLEAMARALFKAWFVDFEPVRAKCRGEPPCSPLSGQARGPAPTGEYWQWPQHILDLFPDRLVESELGEVPEGWRLGALSEFSNIRNGYAFKSSDWAKNGVSVVKIGSVKPIFVDLNQVSFISDSLARQKEVFRLNVGDILVGLTGYVGETGRIPPTKNPPMLNQRAGKFEPKNKLDAFVLACVRMPEFKAFCESKAHGSAQANISTTDLLQYPVTNPGEDLLRDFCKTTQPLFDGMLKNQGEIATLAQLRDTLLPKLISGELRVPDAEAFIKESNL